LAPSTVNTGTTLLYIGGSILVILAAVLLITKRRMNAED
jgi:LPXTG-motif cell wall-anchored protein